MTVSGRRRPLCVMWERWGYNSGVQTIARNLNETYEAAPGSVAQARAQLAEFAAAAGATAEQVDAVRLAASEAMTNSVLHAYRGAPGSIDVNASVVSGEPGSSSPTTDAASSRGLTGRASASGWG